MSPSETALITQVLISAGFLFGIAYLGNRLSFSNRFVNALITARNGLIQRGDWHQHQHNDK